jgi:tetratricopeptide (TPR) repeat protein
MKTMTCVTLALPLCGLAACEDVSRSRAQAPQPARVEVSAQPVVTPPAALAPTPPAAVVVAAPVPAVMHPEDAPPQKKLTGSDALLQARKLLAGGEAEQARSLAKQACKQLPDSFLAWNTLGRVELELDHGAEARAAFEKAVLLRPDSSYAHNNLGLTFIYGEQWERALAELELATSLEPVKPYMWNNLGVVLEHLDRLEEARAAYQKAADDGADNGAASVARLKGVKTVRTASNDTGAGR